MYIVSVAVFKKGMREDLSFWSANEQQPGTIVSVPIRGRYVLGMVVNSEPIQTQKANIKSAPFELRKITSIKGKTSYTDESIIEIKNFAKEYSVSVSEILGDTIGDDGISILLGYEAEALSNKSFSYIHEPRKKRMLMYKRFVREALSNKKVILIVSPTKAFGKNIFDYISPGIEKRIIMGLESGEASPKLFKNVCTSGKSICLITNAKNAFALLPFADVLIIDECGSRFYTNRKKPHIPYNELLTRVAQKSKLKTIITNIHININQYLLTKQKDLVPNSESNTRFLIDSANINFIKRDKENWELFPKESKKIFEFGNDRKIFILSPKSGLFPITVCGDCRRTLSCKVCNAPMKLFEKKGGVREYICPRCSYGHSANITCPVCKSWNLKPFGIGSERILEAIKNEYKDIETFYIDENASLTEIKKTSKEWFDKGGDLVGSERILNKLTFSPDFVCLVSVDSLFGIPNYRITERVLEIILSANDYAVYGTFIITGLENEYLFNEIKRGSLHMFYYDELADRQELKFPPYGYLLNIRKLCNMADVTGVKRLLHNIDPNIEINIYTKDERQVIIIATALYDKQTWLEKIAPVVPKVTDQTFDVFVNETEWLN